MNAIISCCTYMHVLFSLDNYDCNHNILSSTTVAVVIEERI